MATIRGKNEGSIFKQSNGKWRAQVSINGKRLSRVAGSKAECQNWVRKMLNQIDQGLTFEDSNLTLAEYLKEWIAVKKNDLRLRSGFQYERLIGMYIVPILGKIKLKDLNLRIVNQFYETLKNKGVGLSNIRYSHRVLHAALEQAVKSGIVVRNPAHGATLPRTSHKEMKILNDQQVGLFLIAAANSKYKTLYYLAVTTGMRFSELRGLCWSDIDWIKGTIKVSRQIQDVTGKGSVSGAPKSFAGTRTILLGEKSLVELREQQQRVIVDTRKAGANWKDRDLIFPTIVGTPFVSMSLQHDFKRILQSANLPNIRFHDLRHTAASLLLNHGVPALVVSKILGHSNPSITLSIYAHSTVDMQSMAAGIMDEIVTPIPVSIPQLHTTAHDGKNRV